MLDAIVILQLEHRNIGKLLDLIQQQATNISLPDAPVNSRLLGLAFEYLSGYADQCHHPKEDVLCRKLASRYPDFVEPLAKLVEEHEKLTSVTQNLHQAIGELNYDPSKFNKGLADQLRAFVDSYHHHMLLEEQYFFSWARDLLSSNDFAEIEFTLFDKSDPVFSQEAERKFKELSDEITRLGIACRVSAVQREESALLAALMDIAAFNETMRRIGEPVSLIDSSGGGYELKRMGNKLVHIPACSGRRAAWCAYFFWKAAATTRDFS